MTITENLGLIRAIYSGIAPPNNIKIIWYNQNNNLHYYYNTVQSAWQLLKDNSSSPFETGAGTDSAQLKGSGSLADEDYSFAVGSNNVAEGIGSISGGADSQAIGNYSQAIGDGCISSGGASTAGGSSAHAKRITEFARASSDFGVQGDSQYSFMCLSNETVDDTPTELFVDGTQATKRLLIFTDSVLLLMYEIVAIDTDNGDAAGWNINSPAVSGSLLLKNIAGTVVFTGGDTPTISPNYHYDAGAAAWTISLIADNVHKSLKIEVVGEAAKTIRWMAKISICQLGFRNFAI